MNAKKISLVVAAALATSLAAIPSAQADMNNPLHPTYSFSKGDMNFAPIVSGNLPYVDNSPLRPTYSFSKVDTSWVGVGAASSIRYVDSRNPLHPAFKR